MCKIRSVLLIAVILIFSGSQNILKAQSLRAVYHHVPPYVDFFQYNEKQEVTGILSTTKDTSVAIMFYRLIRDAKNNLAIIEVRDVGNTLLYTFKYTFNSEGNAVKIEKISDTDFDSKVDDTEYTYTMSYDSAGLLTHMRILKYFTLARDFEFIWQDGNIVKVINTDGELNYTLLMEYDETANPLKAVKWEYFATTGNIEFYATIFSGNNITKAILVPAAMDTIDLNIKAVYEEGKYVSNTMEGIYFEYE